MGNVRKYVVMSSKQVEGVDAYDGGERTSFEEGQAAISDEAWVGVAHVDSIGSNGAMPASVSYSKSASADDVAHGPPKPDVFTEQQQEKQVSESSNDVVEECEVTEEAMGVDAISESDLRTFCSRCGEIRLVKEWGSGRIVGVGTKASGAPDCEITRLEGEVERRLRQGAIALIAGLVGQGTEYMFDASTDLDNVTKVVGAAIDPNVLTLKICNFAAQVVAHHVGMGWVAPAVGIATEEVLAPVVISNNRKAETRKGLQVLDVGFDVGAGRLTPTVQSFAISEGARVLKDGTAGISQKELGEIADAISGLERCARGGTGAPAPHARRAGA